MKVTFDAKKGVPRFELEEKDLRDAQAIYETMRSPGWKILQDYWTFGRESVIDAGKAGIKTRGKVELSPHKWAILTGWDECTAIAQRVIDRAQEFKATVKSREEEKKNEDEPGTGGEDTDGEPLSVI